MSQPERPGVTASVGPRTAAGETADASLVVGAGLVDRLADLLRGAGLEGRAFVVTDERVGALHAQRLLGALARGRYDPALRAVPATEASKSIETAVELYGWLADERAERRDCVVALGGGLVGDLAGFVAATYLRGLPVVQVPTTLLAQTDSAIGGKTAVNLPRGKNLVGAWHMPRLIVVDPTLLATLPPRELASGWTETIKHGLIMDAGLVEILEAEAERLLRLDPDATTAVVERSARLKVAVVAEDPRERGRRIILNYGHTIGHAIEAATEYGRYYHGEAIAVGLTAAARIGQAIGLTPADLVERQAALLRRFGLPLRAEGVSPERLRAAMRLDKKVEARMVRWVLLRGVADPVVRRDVPEAVVEAALAEVVA